LVRELGLDASALGLLTAAYFLSFAAFQLPLGILLDRFGPRRVEAALLMIAALGAALFAVAPNEGTLIVARALIGFGVSACLMAAFKAYVMWFPLERLALVNGVHLTAGGLGALMATAPVEALLGVTDWRGVFWILAALTAMVSLVLFWVVPERDAGDRHASVQETLGGVLQIFQSASFWRVAPWTVASQATFLSVQSLWVGPWLISVAGFERPLTAQVLFWIAAAMTAGFLSWGILAERLHRWFGVRPMTVAALGMSLFLAAQVAIATEWALALNATLPGALLAAWLVFGFAGTAGVLPYAALSQAFPQKLAGRVNTGLNLIVFVFAFIGQWAVGMIIDLWALTDAGGYAPEGFRAAFWLLIGLQGMAAGWFVLRRRICI
jgi:MFS family permease